MKTGRIMRKVLAMLLVCIMVATAAACNNGGGNNSGNTDAGGSNTAANNGGGGNNATGNTGGGTSDSNRPLNVAVSQDSGTLYPYGVAGNWVTPIYAIYDALLDTYPDGTRKWIVAEGIDPIDDIHSTLRIRKGITFSNGNQLTADDVMFSMELCHADPTFGLVVKVVDFEKTKVIDDYTIDLWYTNYNASQEVGFCQLWIVNKESFDEISLSRDPIGSGPYVVKDYVVNSHLSLEAREDYWGGAPKIKNLNFKVINEEAQIVNALEVGDVDIAAIPNQDVEYVRSLGYDVEVAGNGTIFTAAYNMRTENNPLASKEARWAVSMALDRQAISEILYGSLSSIPNYPASKAMTDFEPRFENLHETYRVGYNPARAQELADQSGLTGQTLRIITNGAAANITIASVIQENLRAIGVEAQIINFEMATYFSALLDFGGWEMAMGSTSVPTGLASDALGMLPMFNPQGWSGDDYSRYMQLSQLALSTFDPAQASEYLYQTIEMFVDFCVWFGICETVVSRAWLPELHGVQYMLAQNVYYQDVYWG